MAAARGHPRSQGRSGRAGAGQAPPSCRSSRALVKKSNEETSQRSKHTEARVYSNLIHLQTAVGESGSMRSRRTLHLNLTACRLGPPPPPPICVLGKEGRSGSGCSVFRTPKRQQFSSHARRVDRWRRRRPSLTTFVGLAVCPKTQIFWQTLVVR